MKRVLDIALSAGGLIMVAPVCAVAAVAVRTTSPGPILYRQERVGLNGASFRIRKFRTMHTDHSGSAVSTATDGRITPIGRVLRRTKIDELPQLLDVLQGHMSLVGPRPEVPEYVAQWPAELRSTILSVRPGVTDPASIVYRNEAHELGLADDPERHYTEVILPRKAEMYATYVRTQSLRGDIKILMDTIRTVATR